MLDRRDFLRLSSALAVSAFTLGSPWREVFAEVTGGPGPYGPLGPPDENGIQLPRGFRSRVLAQSREPVPGTDFPWHVFPDGGATFPLRDGGWVYVSNCEFVVGGGTNAVRFSPRGRVVDAYPICTGTGLNCAGGSTPWGTWLTCEEFPGGTVWECDPLGRVPAQQRLGLGTFEHEAAAVDRETGIVYLTEDVRNGRFYRFVPNAWGNLTSGTLQVAEVRPGGDVVWHDVPQPNPRIPGETPTRAQVPASTAFDGGEGIVASLGHVYFTTKGDHRVWDYLPRRGRLRVLYDRNASPGLPLAGVDNLTASSRGDLIVAEDGDDMELVLITPDREMAPLLRVVGQDASELAGPAFDPSGRRLYVSSQRGGPDGFGITYEIRGPFWQRTPGRKGGG
jgi:secreted PhoX family phosphatase